MTLQEHTSPVTDFSDGNLPAEARTVADTRIEWRELSSEEQQRFQRGKEPPTGKIWLTSPCGLIVEIREDGIEALLMERLDDEYIDTALEGLMPSECMLADFFSAYGMYDRLIDLLESSDTVVSYVLAIPAGRGREHVPHAQDLARSIVARHAARAALEEFV